MPGKKSFIGNKRPGFYMDRYSLFICICTCTDTPVTHEDEKDDILNLLKSQITDVAASRDKATKVYIVSVCVCVCVCVQVYIHVCIPCVCLCVTLSIHV